MNGIIMDIETLSLDPLEEGAQVVCIATQSEDFATALLSKDEKQLLKQFWIRDSLMKVKDQFTSM